MPSSTFQPPGRRRRCSRVRPRTFPALGWPQTTGFLCPGLRVKRDAGAHPSGRDRSERSRQRNTSAEIKAQILERDGKVIIEKTCPQHGTFTDVLAINPAFLTRIESLFPGRDYHGGHRSAAQPRHVVDQATAADRC